nr:helix-turn-helix domain-containing protein [Serratia ureilytica]
MISDGKSQREIAKLLEVNTRTVNRWLTDHQYPTKLIEQIRHWSVILESLHGPKPLNVSSPIYKPTRKTAKQDEKSRNIVAKERQDKQDYKHRLQAVGH